MTDPELIDVEHDVSMTFWVYRYSDGSVLVRKPEGNDVACQYGIHTMSLTEDEGKALARILSRPAKPVVATGPPSPRHPELFIGGGTPE